MIPKINSPKIAVAQRKADVISTLGVGDRQITQNLRLLHVSHMLNNTVKRKELGYSGLVAVRKRKFVGTKICTIQRL